jgi:DNA-binding NtrC family response regulator
MKTSILIVSTTIKIEPSFESVLGKLEPIVVPELLTALKILKKHRFDICFIQIHLSKNAEFHLLKRIQKIAGSCDLLIALEQNQIQKGIDVLGSYGDYLVIPYAWNELKLKLEKILTKRNLERENRFWRVELAALLADRKSITLEDIPAEIWEKGVGEVRKEGQFFKRSRSEFERECLRGALERARGSQTQAAKSLGIHRNTLIWKLKKLNLMAECQKIVRKRKAGKLSKSEHPQKTL